MVELSHAAVADPAMLGAKWPNHPAGVAQAQDVRAPGALPLVVASDLLDGAKERVNEKLLNKTFLKIV